jgi:hypothetical protein
MLPDIAVTYIKHLPHGFIWALSILAMIPNIEEVAVPFSNSNQCLRTGWSILLDFISKLDSMVGFLKTLFGIAVILNYIISLITLSV